MPATVERTMDLLRLLGTDDAGLTVSDVAAKLNTSVASASRMVKSLRDTGAVERDEKTGRVFLSIGMWQIGSAVLRRLEFRRISIPAVAAVLPDLGRPINLTVPDRNNALSVETYDLMGRFIATTEVGKPTPYHAATNGKALLAFMAEEDAQRVLSRPLSKHTDRTITDKRRLMTELAFIRQHGVSLNRGEYRPGAIAVGVPLLNDEGVAIAAFSTPCSEEELDQGSRPARTLINLVRTISSQLGFAEDAHEAFA